MIELKNLRLSEIQPSKMNPRKEFFDEDLKELAENIRKQGLQQPIKVRPQFDEDLYYEIVCGERRYRACSKIADELGFSPADYEIPCIVEEMSDEEAFDAMISENLQRKDVQPTEEAASFTLLIERGESVEEVAARFGKTKRYVQDRLKLMSLIPELQLAMKDGNVPLGAALLICKLDEEKQKRYYDSYSNSYSGITLQSAKAFINNQFKHIMNAEWDESYTGGCGKACKDCEYNTNNYGCLFWEMKGDEVNAKCTSPDGWMQKKLNHAVDIIKNFNPLKKGEHFEPDTAIISELPFTNTKVEFNKELHRIIEQNGWETAKPYELFDSPCYYGKEDERLKEYIKKGEVYPVIEVCNERVQKTYYYVKKDKDNSPVVNPSTLKLEEKIREAKNDLKRNEELRLQKKSEKFAERIRTIDLKYIEFGNLELTALLYILANAITGSDATDIGVVRSDWKWATENLDKLNAVIARYVENKCEEAERMYVKESDKLMLSAILEKWDKVGFDVDSEGVDEYYDKKKDKLEATLNELEQEISRN